MLKYLVALKIPALSPIKHEKFLSKAFLAKKIFGKNSLDFISIGKNINLDFLFKIIILELIKSYLFCLIVYMFLIPTIVSGKITLGIMNQILRAFGQVASSFQFLVNSWTTIIDLISVYKRLQAFEASIYDRDLPKIDQEFIKTQRED